jgi:hypothetical protein
VQHGALQSRNISQSSSQPRFFIHVASLQTAKDSRPGRPVRAPGAGRSARARPRGELPILFMSLRSKPPKILTRADLFVLLGQAARRVHGLASILIRYNKIESGSWRGRVWGVVQLVFDNQTQGPSVLLPPQTRKSGAIGDPGSRAFLPIHAHRTRVNGGPHLRALALRPSG